MHVVKFNILSILINHIIFFMHFLLFFPIIFFLGRKKDLVSIKID